MRLPPTIIISIIIGIYFFALVLRILIKRGHDDECHTDDSQSPWL